MLTIIQIAIAIIVVYLAFSIMVYVIVEWIAGILKLRGKTLKDAILKIFENTPYKDFGEDIFKHPQIESLKNKKGNLPSYIPANNIAVALIDLIKERASNSKSEFRLSTESTKLATETQVYELYKNGLAQLDNVSGTKEITRSTSPVNKSFLSSITEQTTDLQSLTSAIETWYNSYMDRVSGWYKRNIKVIVLVIGILVTIAFNVDTIHVVKVAATDPTARERLNRFADELIKDSVVNNLVMQQRNNQEYFEDYVNDDSFEGKTIAEQNEKRDSLVAEVVNRDFAELQRLNQLVHEWDLPVGWNIKKDHNFWWTLLGWFITALALSAGAPFWFDLLKRLVNIRSSGGKPDTPKKE